MIRLIFGKPGSGKTSLAVQLILENANKYQKVISNIYGLNHDNCINEYLKKDIKFETFNSEKQSFYNQILQIKLDRLDSGYVVDSTDTDKKSSANTQNDYYLLIIDECQDFLKDYTKNSQSDSDVVALFSKHRHLHLDIFLMTQDLNLINYMYKGSIAEYLQAKNQNYSLSKSLSFNLMDNNDPKKTLIQRNHFKVKTNDKYLLDGEKRNVFYFYESGDNGKKNIKTFNVLHKFILILISLLIAFFSYFYFNFVDSDENTIFYNASSPENNKTIPGNKIRPIFNNSFTQTNDFIYKKVLFSKNRFYLLDYVLTPQLFKSYLSKFNMSILFIDKFTKNSSFIYLKIPNNVYFFLTNNKFNPQSDKKSLF